MLQVNQLAIAYNNVNVVHDISFSLEKGEIGCLLGPSGCGKTSILRAVCGFVPVSSGEIWINDKRVATPASQDATQQRNVGMVFQDYALFPHLTVAENVAFGLNKLSSSDRTNRINECLQLVDMQAFDSRMPHELSGGQQQRVALARALAPKPQILLMDEPFSSLDVSLRETLANDVRHILKEENITGLLVTHDQQEAFAVADSIGVINQGNMHQWGTADALYNQPNTEFVASFIGEGVLIDISDAERVSKLLIRPEHIDVSESGKFSGTVVSRLFRGSYFLYQINVSDLSTQPCIVLGTGELAKPYELDQAVKLNVDFDKSISL
jgi:iron(III) transport system ATP-binding protein